MHSSLTQIQHRPWPLPSGSWQWRQTWASLAFLHYRVSADQLANRLPAGLALDTFDGSAWVSVVPFQMMDVAPRSFPIIPPMHSFPELNLRTYVTDGNKAGVWFFSLDTNNLPFAIGGRLLYGLPYFPAKMTHAQQNEIHTFSSQRRRHAARFEVRYRPAGDRFHASPGTFEHWITEKYCLYAQMQGALLCLDVHHHPWPLQSAEVEIRENKILEAAGIIAKDTPPICHYSSGVQVISYAPRKTNLLSRSRQKDISLQ